MGRQRWLRVGEEEGRLKCGQGLGRGPRTRADGQAGGTRGKPEGDVSGRS